MSLIYYKRASKRVKTDRLVAAEKITAAPVVVKAYYKTPPKLYKERNEFLVFYKVFAQSLKEGEELAKLMRAKHINTYCAVHVEKNMHRKGKRF